MRARLPHLLIAGVLIAGGVLPSAQATEKREMSEVRNATAAGIIAAHHMRKFAAITRHPTTSTSHAFAQAHPRTGQSLALCCIASVAPPDAEMIVVTDGSALPEMQPEPELPAAPPPAVKANDAPRVETVAGVTIMRGSIAQPTTR
jgi:hypothetical protein